MFYLLVRLFYLYCKQIIKILFLHSGKEVIRNKSSEEDNGHKTNKRRSNLEKHQRGQAQRKKQKQKKEEKIGKIKRKTKQKKTKRKQK